MRRIIWTLLVLALPVLVLAAKWQPKKYDGTGLGLYIAPGDTIRAFAADIDTVAADTINVRRLRAYRAWIDTLDGDSIHFTRASFDMLSGGTFGATRVHIDTLSGDSLTAWLAYIDHLSGAWAHFDTLTADSMNATHIAGAVVEADVAYIDYLNAIYGTVDTLRADSLTVHGSMRADSLFGDGSNLTGIAAGDTAGLRVEWRSDVGDTANVLRGELGQGGALTSAMRLDSIACTAAGQVPGGQVAITGDATYLYSASASGLMSFSKASGALTTVDSVGTPTHAVFALGGYIYTTDSLKAYKWSSTAGMLAKVDSVDLPDNGLSIHGAIVGDSTWVYVSDDDGQVNVCSAAGTDLTLVATVVADNGGIGYDVWASGLYVYLANGEDGWYSFTNDGAGGLTEKTHYDPDAMYGTAVAVTGDAGMIYGAGFSGWIAADCCNGMYTFTRDPDGTMATADFASIGGQYPRDVWVDGSTAYVAMHTYRQGVIVFSVTTGGIISEASDYPRGGSAPEIANTLFGDGTYLYYLPDDAILTLESRPVVIIDRPVTVDVDGTPTAGMHDFTVQDGAANSWIEAGDTDWTGTSDARLKYLGQPLTPTLAARVLDLLADSVAVQPWRWKSGGALHVGPTAQDWYRVARLLRPGAADSLQISGADQTAALLLAVQELARRDAALTSEIADLRKRTEQLESTRYDK
jgi:hypothetical protein